MDILTLVPLPVCISPELCKLSANGARYGSGLAVCQDLGLLVISSCDRLQVFALPDDIVARCHVQSELALVRTLGGDAPMEFQFWNSSGYMAFTDGCGGVSTANRRLLLVTEHGKSDGSGAVHVIDVVRGAHVGYVAAPGTIRSPKGVATRKSFAAVSCQALVGYNSEVRVFEGSSGTWRSVRTITVAATGLRFTADGLGLVVPEYFRGCLRVFSVTAEDSSPCSDGGKLNHPMDVEECAIRDDGGMRAGWVVCEYRGLVAVTDNARDASNTDVVTGWRGDNCSALAVVAGLGLLMVRHGTGVQFLATPDAVAMASMSLCKVAWMVAACRGLFVSAIARRL